METAYQRSALDVSTNRHGILPFGNQRNTNPLQRLGALGRSLPLKQRVTTAGWIERIGASHQFSQDGRVLHIAGHGADRI